MSAYIPRAMRQAIADRAGHRCEYCRLPRSPHKHQPDHILPLQHGGLTAAENLALACYYCNHNKGPNVGSFDIETGRLVPFFNPRAQVWTEHFRLDGAAIQPLTPEARVTARLFRFNDPERVTERETWIGLGLY